MLSKRTIFIFISSAIKLMQIFAYFKELYIIKASDNCSFSFHICYTYMYIYIKRIKIYLVTYNMKLNEHDNSILEVVYIRHNLWPALYKLPVPFDIHVPQMEKLLKNN